MLVLPNQKTPILIQGITSELGTVHTELAIAYGTHIVAGTSRDKNVDSFQNIPVFRTVKEAVRKTKPLVSVIFSSPARALGDVEEAARAKIPLIICTTERVPLHDALKMAAAAEKYHVTLIGPSSPGIVRAGECIAGTIPAHLFPKGSVGIIGRSSSLIYEAVQQLAEEGLGVSTCVALGAAPIVGTSFEPIFDALSADPATKVILVIGQLSGQLENDLAAAYHMRRRKKPLVVYIPGGTMRRTVRTPLIGTPAFSPAGIVAEKRAVLEKAGAVWVDDPAGLGQAVARYIRKKVVPA